MCGINAGHKYFSGPIKLTGGITLGVHHMFEAKRGIVKKMYETQPADEIPGTVQKLLPGGVVVMDEEAGGGMKGLLAVLG